MNTLAFTRVGAGEPLVLLHALGLSRSSWDPVLAELSEWFDVLAVDLPGFGDSPPLDPQVEPEPAALARSVAQLLDELGIEQPHVAGNSLGGWVALELAGLRPVASLVLLSPAGDDLVVQRLRPVVHQPELLQGRAAIPLTEATAHRLDRDVPGGAGLWITGGQHDSDTGALQVTVEGLPTARSDRPLRRALRGRVAS